ncbi:MAG TPA: PAS domain S-box protein [bacterium]|nr:PAS domain S-box protein [bacterium]
MTSSESFLIEFTNELKNNTTISIKEPLEEIEKFEDPKRNLKFKPNTPSFRIIILGLVLSAFYLIIEGVLDTYIFQKYDNFFQDIFTTDPHEIFMHLCAICLILFIGVLSQYLLNSQRKTDLRLKESEKKYRLLIETSPVSILLIDSKGFIIDCNKASERITNFSRKNLLNKHFGEIFQFKGEKLQWIFKIFTKAINGELKEPLEMNVLIKKGKMKCLETAVSLIDIEGEKFLQILSKDITSRKRAEELIREEIEKLKDLDKIKNNLIARSSYELKNPLTSICNASELLLKIYKDKLDDRASKLLKIVNKGGKRLSSLITRFTEISEIKSKGIELKVEFANITKIIQDCINEMSYQALERNQFLNALIDETVYIYADISRIKQVISEVILNAIYNTPPNGMISVDLQNNQNYINILIKDSGVGFTEDEKMIIFKEFGKIERYGKGLDIIADGMGLGLYISKKIIELHNGEIWVDSKGRNKGSTFIIKLPIKN